MEEQHGVENVAHYKNGSPFFRTIPQPPRDPHHDLHYEMVVVGSGGSGRTIRSDPNPGAGSKTDSLSIGNGGSEMEIIGGGVGDVHRRWSRQETLTLLEVRLRLNSKFKEANHKCPLWNEVSRIMCEEHGYQRTGKKCREKFENLHKYYKRTKVGKTGRHDGKHYRFFRQLEAIYGESGTSTNYPSPNPNHAIFSGNHNLNVVSGTFQPHLHRNDIDQEAPSQYPFCDNPSVSNNSSAYDTFSADHENPYASMGPFMEYTDGVERAINKRKLSEGNWKNKIKDFIDAHMRKIMDKQEAWMEKMMKTIEEKEQERISRVQQWRKDEIGRLESEYKFWGKQRAWMESRESVLMQTLHKLTDKESLRNASFPECNDHTSNPTCWGENEIMQLIHFRTDMGIRFEQGGIIEEVLWDEIASKMASLGYNRNGSICNSKWDSINQFIVRSKKRKQNRRSSNFQYQVGTFHELFRSEPLSDHQNDGCYRLFMGDEENH